MLDPHLTGTEAECRTYLGTCNKALGLPWDSVAVGGGRHAPTKARTTAWTDVRRHPDREEYSVKILQGAPTDALSVAEVQAMGDAEAAGVDLDESWKAKEAEPLPGKL